MTDKLDFTGFEADQIAPPPRRREARPRTVAKRRDRKPTGRRKLRVNVSIDPNLSVDALHRAEHRGMTLSDLVRAAYREHSDSLSRSSFAERPEPFGVAPRTTTGRIVHMLYLTPEEVEILDQIAGEYGSSRSGVVSALLRKA